MGPYGGYQEPPQQPGGGYGNSDWVGALINAGAGLYDSYQNRKAARENTDKTIAAQKEEAELAYQRSLEQWSMQNAYNTPEAQMARYRNAGLNEHLIYGQGNSGNAGSPAPYQPANLQYRYQAAGYGAAIQTILPTLMQVGSWMQNMRMSEVQMDKMTTDTERSQQLIDYLIEANPKLIRKLDNDLSIFPYQKEAQKWAAAQGNQKLADMVQDYRYKYGEDLFRDLQFYTGADGQSKQGGLRRLQYLEQESKTKLAEAKASWTEYDVTDPQKLMQLVLSGVFNLAGISMRGGAFKPGAIGMGKASTGKINQRSKYNSTDFWRKFGK